MDADERAAELTMTERVGREFARLGLRVHLARTREYYRDVRAARPSKAWSHEMSVEWLRLLRLPPHESDYPVQRRGSGCTACPTSRPFTVTTFPGGCKSKCACGHQWLELDERA